MKRHVFISIAALLALAAPAAAQPVGTPNFVGVTANTGTFGSLTTTGAAGANAASVTATGSTTARTLGDRAADVINIRDRGAKCDGTTNDTAAIQAAAAAIPATGGVVYIPPGVCLVRATTFLKSNTTVKGDGWGSVLLADATWPATGGQYAVFENVNWAATSITDTNITIQDIQLDYGSFGPILPSGGGKHMVRFRQTQNVIVRNVLFQTRGAEDAVAGLGVLNMLVDGNSAYDFRNCAYDFWTSPTKVRIVNNYAQTDHSAQVFNFNPEGAVGPGVASGLVVANNNFVVTGARAGPSIAAPLAAGTTVDDIVVAGNLFDNAYLVIRGAVTNAVVSNNVFNKPRGGDSVILAYANAGGTPNNLTISGNNIVDPDTAAPNIAVIRADATGTMSTITGNTISGSSYSAVPGIATGTNVTVVSGNYVSTGAVSTSFSISNTGDLRVPNGSSMKWYDASGGPVYMKLQTDNNLVAQGTDATGAIRNLFSIQQRNSTSPFIFAIPIATSQTVQLTAIPTTCTGHGSGTLWSNAGVVNICP